MNRRLPRYAAEKTRLLGTNGEQSVEENRPFVPSRSPLSPGSVSRDGKTDELSH